MGSNARLIAAAAVALEATVACASFGQTSVGTINTKAAGTPFSPGVRGMAAPALNITRNEYKIAIPKTLQLSKGTSIRGYAGGLEADLFNWETRNNDARPSTLQYLKYARDYGSEMVFTANARGLVKPDPNDPTKKVFYDTSTATLSSLAADWVRYTNRIVRTYRTGATITDTRDNAILNKLTWSSSTPGDSWPKLLSSTEAITPRIKYWEIGNEPRVSLTNSYGVTNSYTFTGADGPAKYAERYNGMTKAMKAEDSTIKVGPCLQGLTTEQSLLDAVLSNPATPVDFISYHPYQKLNTFTTAVDMEMGLQGVYAYQKSKTDYLRGRLTANGRDPSKVELLASEVNVSNWSSNDTPAEATMAHALGSVETVFSFARLGVHASHYWIWPANRNDGTEYPEFKAYKYLQNFMGDTMLSTFSSGNSRLYTTRNSKSGEIDIWGLNFSDTLDSTLKLSLSGLTGSESATVYTLGAKGGGDTGLFTSNLSSDMPGGPTSNIDWSAKVLTGQLNFSNFNLTLPDATMSVLVIKPSATATAALLPEPSVTSLAFAAVVFANGKSRRRKT
jgi:hypothetical protein